MVAAASVFRAIVFNFDADQYCSAATNAGSSIRGFIVGGSKSTPSRSFEITVGAAVAKNSIAGWALIDLPKVMPGRVASTLNGSAITCLPQRTSMWRTSGKTSASSNALLSSTFDRIGRSQPRVHKSPRYRDGKITTSASKLFSAATFFHSAATAVNSPPDRSAHSPCNRLIASTTPGSFTTSTRNATLARDVSGAGGGPCRGQPASVNAAHTNRQQRQGNMETRRQGAKSFATTSACLPFSLTRCLAPARIQNSAR